MTQEERNDYIKVCRGEITGSELFRRHPQFFSPDYIYKLLEDALRDKNVNDVHDTLVIGYMGDCYSKEFVPVLISLMQEDWNTNHQEIASLFQQFRDPRPVEAIYQRILKKVPYLDEADNLSLARRCIWALGDINVPESKEKLRLLANSEDPEIKEYALEQLARNL